MGHLGLGLCTCVCDWRDSFCTALANAPMTAPGEYAGRLETMKQSAAFMAHERWAESRDGVVMLSGEPGFLTSSASLMGIIAQIDLASFSDIAGAEEWLGKAAKLTGDADMLQVCVGWTRYWLLKGDEAKAIEFAHRGVAVDPNRQEGYIALAECNEAAMNLEEAERNYQDAISAASGSSGAYLQLIRLYCRPELFAKHRDKIPALVVKASAVDPSAEYSILLTLAQFKRDSEAIESYSRAIKLDPTRLRGYLELGNAHLSLADQTARGKKALEEARTAFQTAIVLAPQAYDGYWYMATLCEREGRWEEGLEFCAQCLRLQPRLEGRFRSKRADFLRMLKQLPMAEAELELALHADKTGVEPIQAMMALADAYYQEQGDREAALRLYRLTRETRGNTFDAEYENLIGNLHYYFKEYAEAAQAYQNAVAKSPKNAVLYSNLALALEQMTAVDRAEQFDEIINALRYACRLMPGNAEYSARLANFEHRKRFLLHYGEPATRFRSGRHSHPAGPRSRTSRCYFDSRQERPPRPNSREDLGDSRGVANPVRSDHPRCVVH